MEAERDYQIPQEPKKRPIWFWGAMVGLGLLIVFVVGSCITMFSGLLEKISERKAATKIFIAETLPDGLPLAENPIYHPQFGATSADLAHINSLIEAAGEPEEIQETSCSGKTNASTTPIDNGTFVFCNTAVQYSTTKGAVEMTWKLSDGEWKILRFHISYDRLPEIAPVEGSSNN